MRLRLILTFATTTVGAGYDLGLDYLHPGSITDLHQRSTGWLVLTTVLLVIVVALTVLPSRLTAFAAGLVAGGIVGNLTSAVTDRGLVPNPFVVQRVAFNLGDVLIVAGAPLLIIALSRVAIRNREHIDRRIPPRRWELVLRRKLGL